MEINNNKTVNKMEDNIMVFAQLKSGVEMQIELIGDNLAIMQYIENYEGDDLGNDIIMEDFVDDFNDTGVRVF